MTSRQSSAYRIGIFSVALASGWLGIRTATSSAAAVAASGNIVGHVTDSAGQPIPGATVRAVPQRGGPETHTTSDSHGNYTLEGLPDDTYRVDFALQGFSVTRRNAVQVRAGAPGKADGVLFVRPVCECVSIDPPPGARLLAGRVVDESGRPVPGARLEIAGPQRREKGYANREGDFFVYVPAEGHWSITASESAFRAATLQVSGTSPVPLVLRLRYAGTAGLPETERLMVECDCPPGLFARGSR